MNKKGAALGLVGGIIGLVGGITFLYLLLTFFGTGAVLGISGSKGILMLGIFLLVLWILVKKK